jgi:hypothetical protein
MRWLHCCTQRRTDYPVGIVELDWNVNLYLARCPGVETVAVEKATKGKRWGCTKDVGYYFSLQPRRHRLCR